MNDALGYIRVSSEEQADSGLGLEAQRQRIAAYCAMKELRLGLGAVGNTRYRTMVMRIV
jgi:DNA invertase Pin-like site-specific DNA recombinase